MKAASPVRGPVLHDEPLASSRSITSRGIPPDFPVAAVGASAGGLEALRVLFGATPTDSGVAWIVQQHLSPDFESHMVELLARSTPLPVEEASDGLILQPDHVYVAPPGKEMIVADGMLLLTERDPSETFSLPINHLFRALALSAGERAIGIILSGTGSDGTKGLRSIHEAGGLTVCQNASTAAFDGMIRNALQTEAVDLVLAPEDIGSAVKAYVRGTPVAELVRSAPPSAPPEDDHQRLFDLLHRSHGLDFRLYKPSTVLRRLERRAQLLGVSSVEAYVQRLQEDAAEREALYSDMLIGVTAFFRDPEVFASLRAVVLPELVARAAGEDRELRVWVAGCATGEEAYSIAILLDEVVRESGSQLDVRVLATDVHRRSIEVASRGVYPDSALQQVSLERRQRYFEPGASVGTCTVSKHLRSKVIFAAHDVISGAPFTKLDLVTCRNLLIYLEPFVQKKVLSLFHFGLRPDGFLLLGSSESPGSLHDEFEAIHARHRLYRKRRDIRLPVGGPLGASMAPASALPNPVSQGQRTRPMGEKELLHLYDRLLEEYMPPSLLVDEQQRLLHVFGSADSLLRMRPGRVSTDVIELLHPALKTAAVSALRRCEQTGGPVRYAGISNPTEAGSDSQSKNCVVCAQRVERGRGMAPAFVLRFETAPPVRPDQGDSTPEILNAASASHDYIRGLEADLQFTREDLQATIEELETSNEELQAANEELVASNEELQSTNEELNSVNEELHSVNTEHQLKIAELLEVTQELDSLLEGSQLGILFVDAELRIRRFTKPMAHLLRLHERDEGRSLEDFARNVENLDLEAVVRDVLRDGTPVEREVVDAEGRIHLLRVLAHPRSDAIQGALLTLLDIDRRKRAEQETRLLSAITKSASDAILAKDVHGIITAWNAGAAQLYGYRADEIVGKNASVLVPELEQEAHTDMMRRVLEGHAVIDQRTRRRHKDGHVVDVSLTLSPVLDETGETVGISSIARDMTFRRQVEEAQRRAEEHREAFLAMLAHELRNPLMGLTAAADTLSESEDEASTRLASEVVARQTRHMAALLRDLFDVSRVKQGKFEVAKRQMDLRAMLEGPLDVASSRCEAKGLRFDVRVPDAPLHARGDVTRLRQVITNLLDNAIDHSSRGGRVEVALRPTSDGTACLTITDEGRGMDEETLQHVFEPFFQGAAPRRRKGLGLGLALVRSIVEAHGGMVRAESQGRGRGTRFEVVLPCAEAPKQRDRRTVEGRPLRVLVVEDEPDNRELTVHALRRRGYDVESVASVGQARSMLDQRSFDVVVSDLGLPDGSGHEVAGYIKSKAPEALPLLIALSGHSQPTDREASQQAGFDHHLVKPTSVRQLSEIIVGEYAVERRSPGEPPTA